MLSSFSLTRTLTSRLKPHRTEAIARIRFNALSLLVLFILSVILPGAPSLPTAIAHVLARRAGWNKAAHGGLDEEGLKGWMCLIESSLTAIFLFNIVESVYAIKYPRATPPPAPGGNKGLSLKSPSASQTPKKPFAGVVSPQSSPQPQKPFSFSSSLSSSSQGSSYPISPISTPSRSVVYNPISTPRSSVASSTSTVGYTPSPNPAYRGRAFGGSMGRPLDGSYLGRIIKTEDSEEE